MNLDRSILLLAAATFLGSCTAPTAEDTRRAGRPIDAVDSVVVIYAENRAFDNLYGNFPGAHNGIRGRAGLAMAGQPRRTTRNAIVDGRRVERRCRPAWGGVTALGQYPGGHAGSRARRPAQRGRSQIEHALHGIDSRGSTVPSTASVDARPRGIASTSIMMQIDGGSNDGYAAWSDAGGLVDSATTITGAGSSLWTAWRSEFVLADNFFHGRFRRLVPQPPVPDLRLRAGVPGCRRGELAGQGPDPSRLLEQDAAGHLLPFA